MSTAASTSAAAAASAAGSDSFASPSDIAAFSLTHSLNTSAAARLTLFIAKPHVKERYTAAADAYLSATVALRQAMEQRDKFKAACNSNPPAIRLPSSMQMQLVKHAKLTPVAGDPAFYREQTAALERIESESATQIYATLLAAKDKHIAHLQSQANAHSFLARMKKEHEQFVQAYATDCDKSYGTPPAAAAAAAASSSAALASAAASSSAPSSFFPFNEAVAHFDSFLQQSVNELVMLTVDERQARLAAKAQALVEDSKAQEQVLAGAHTGESIAMIVQQKVAPIQQQLQRLQQQQQRTSAAQPPQSRPAAAPPAAPRFNTHRSHSKSNAPVTFADTPHSSSKPSSSPAAAGSRPRANRKRQADEPSEQLQITAQGRDRSVSSRGHAGHAANNDSSNPRSKNVRGGDRSHTPSRRATQLQSSSPNPQRQRSKGRERNSRDTHRPPHSRR